MARSAARSTCGATRPASPQRETEEAHSPLPQTWPTQSRADPDAPAPGPAGPQPYTPAANASPGSPRPPTLLSGATPTSGPPLQDQLKESPGPTPPPVSRHQPGALGFWKRPPRDQTLPPASSVHTGQGPGHPPARQSPRHRSGEGTPRTLPPHPGQKRNREMENEWNPDRRSRRRHAPDEEQDRPQQQTREICGARRAPAGVQKSDCGWPGARAEETCAKSEVSNKAKTPRTGKLKLKSPGRNQEEMAGHGGMEDIGRY